jgi:integrase
LDPSSGHLGGVTDATREGYQQIAARSFLKILGPLPLDAITKQDVARWIAWQEKQPPQRDASRTVSAKTVKNYHSVLSAILRAAQEDGVIPANTARGAKLSRGRRVEMVLLTESEFQQKPRTSTRLSRSGSRMSSGTRAARARVRTLSGKAERAHG